MPDYKVTVNYQAHCTRKTCLSAGKATSMYLGLTEAGHIFRCRQGHSFKAERVVCYEHTGTGRKVLWEWKTGDKLSGQLPLKEA